MSALSHVLWRRLQPRAFVAGLRNAVILTLGLTATSAWAQTMPQDASYSVTVAAPYSLGEPRPELGNVVSEGQDMVFTVMLERDMGFTQAVSLQYGFPAPDSVSLVAHDASANAATGGTDYHDASGTITFTGEERFKQVTVRTLRDAVAEGDEYFFLRISDASGNEQTTTWAWISDVGVVQATDVTALNKTALPHVASMMTRGNALIIENRIRGAFRFRDNPSRGVSLQGSGLDVGVAKMLKNRAIPQDLTLAMSLDGQADNHAIPNMLTVWSRGYQTRIDVDDEDRPFDGEATGAMVGFDAIADNLLVGVGFNQSHSKLDYVVNGAFADFVGGVHETRLRGVHPYIAWEVADELRLWSAVGYERGDIEVVQEHGSLGSRNREKIAEYDVEMRTFSLGGSGMLHSKGERGSLEGATRVGFVGDATTSRLKQSGDGGNSIGPRLETVESGWLRAGLEIDYGRSLQAGGTQGAVFEVTWRQDIGDAENGLELGGNVDWVTAAGLRLDVGARSLLTHNKDTNEWGVSGGVAWQSAPSGRGFSLSFQPQWGDTVSDKERLWEDGISSLRHSDELGPRYALELKYGIGLVGESELLTLFARDKNNTTGVGADYRLGGGVTAGYEALRYATGVLPSDHRAYLRYRRDF